MATSQPKNSAVFEERYANLNPEQKRAVDTIHGPVLVVAGPGSGKTELLSIRVANILYKTDAYPSNILCLTFTDSAAVNMRKRLEGLIGPDAYRVAIHTFHSFGAEIINHYPEFFYRGAMFSPADDLLQAEVITSLIEQLPHNDPVRSLHPEQGYVYLTAIKNAIGSLKKSGITHEEFSFVVSQNSKCLERISERVNEVFGERITKKSFEKIKSLIDDMIQMDCKMSIPSIVPITNVIASSLDDALKESQSIDKSSPLSDWKSKYTKKVNNRRILKDAYYIDHMRTLADLYAKYQKEMHKRGFFDFDDMLLETIKGIESNDTLKSELQEKYQYVLIDEFQDTNGAQMRMIRALTDNPVYEKKPNIMAVGDDDQAIFKFQGAELSNILEFKNLYDNPEIITLINNYRSTQDVLDLSGFVISQGSRRLENILPEVEKRLIASNDSLDSGSVNDIRLKTVEHERQYIADQIENKIKEGTDPSEIAVIARRHADLQGIAPVLTHRGIPVSYERQLDVFREPHIRQLITMCRFVASLGRKDVDEADDFLPEILSYPFWGINREHIMSLSVMASSNGECDCGLGKECKEKHLWLHRMLHSGHDKIAGIAEFFADLGIRSQHEPAEYILNDLVGADPHKQPEFDEPTEDYDSKPSVVSPFKSYYFSRDKLESDPVTYIQFLTSLQMFIRAVREYKKGAHISIKDLIEFVDLHEANNLKLLNTSVFASGSNAVSLLSAHKAKGMEFDTVFVLSCQESVWSASKNRNMLPFPANMPIAPAGDDMDDYLRLFYVAITRAKRNLYITSHETDASGKESLKVPFIPLKESSFEKSDVLRDISIITNAWESVFSKPLSREEKEILKPLVKDYKMSVTHLNNFLNIERGGPRAFLENNLLRFPQPKSASGSYGTAIHSTIARVYAHLKINKKLPDIETVIEWFQDEMRIQRLSDSDFELYKNKGIDALKVYYANRASYFDGNHDIEIDFSNQGVHVKGAHLSGKIDKIIKNEPDKTIEVVDFKTGRAESKWSKSSSKILGYRRQLLFYKILIENSRSYGDYSVNSGSLEFVEPKDERVVILNLDIDKSETERLEKLISVVYDKIINLDFPDTDNYSPDAKGMIEFEESLLKDFL